MKIESRQVEAFLRKPDPKIRGVVVYGNDDGLIAERAVTLAKTVCEDLKDPFRVVDIAGEPGVAIGRNPGVSQVASIRGTGAHRWKHDSAGPKLLR